MKPCIDCKKKYPEKEWINSNEKYCLCALCWWKREYPEDEELQRRTE